MGFGEAVKTVFSKVWVFEGRARRAEFWWFYLFLQLVGTALGVVLMIVMFAAIIPVIATTNGQVSDGAAMGALGGLFLFYGLVFLFSAALFVLQLGVWVRRLHDVGQSGHWLWLNLVSLGIVPLIMCIQDGQPFTNQYGPDPKAAERAFLPPLPGAYAAPAAPPVDPGADPFAAPPRS